jgi:putative heme-binding domain-containing protein
MYGHGKEVGPDITLGGRGTLEALLSNVVDPNLVIGSGYLAHTLWTTDGQVYNGVVVEDSPNRVSLKLEGAEVVAIPRDRIDEMKKSEVSLMPEGLLEGLEEQEVRDLIGFLMTTEAPAPWNEIEAEEVQAVASE